MDMIYDFPFVNGEGLSVEANSDGYNLLSNQNNTVFESDISSLFNTDLFGPDSTKDPFCDPIEYFGKREKEFRTRINVLLQHRRPLRRSPTNSINIWDRQLHSVIKNNIEFKCNFKKFFNFRCNIGYRSESSGHQYFTYTRYR